MKFPLFGLGREYPTVLGVDFGTSTVRAIEISCDGPRPRLVNYAVLPLPTMTDGEGSAERVDQRMEEVLAVIMRDMKPQTKNICVALPNARGLITLLTLPMMTEQTLQDFLSTESQKYIPVPLSEVIVGHVVLTTAQQSSKEGIGNVQTEQSMQDTLSQVASQGATTMDVLLVAAPRKDIELYQDVVRHAGLSLVALELEVFSLTRALVGDDSGTFILVDMGALATNIVLVRNGVVLLNRNVDVGGNDITRAIAESMNVSFERAEKIKRQKDPVPTQGTPPHGPVFDLVVHEIRRMMDVFVQQNLGDKIDAIILSGGSARFVGAAEYFGRSIENIAVTCGDPWRRVDVDVSMKGSLDALGGSFSIAIGLALRAREERLKGRG